LSCLLSDSIGFFADDVRVVLKNDNLSHKFDSAKLPQNRKPTLTESWKLCVVKVPGQLRELTGQPLKACNGGCPQRASNPDDLDAAVSICDNPPAATAV